MKRSEARLCVDAAIVFGCCDGKVNQPNLPGCLLCICLGSFMNFYLGSSIFGGR